MKPAPLTRIGLNALYIVPGEVGGVEIYARELTQALAAAAGTLSGAAERLGKLVSNLRIDGEEPPQTTETPTISVRMPTPVGRSSVGVAKA